MTSNCPLKIDLQSVISLSLNFLSRQLPHQKRVKEKLTQRWLKSLQALSLEKDDKPTPPVFYCKLDQKEEKVCTFRRVSL
jgi:hypothetical protein